MPSFPPGASPPRGRSSLLPAALAVFLLAAAHGAAPQGLGSLVSPGPLSKAHAGLEGLSNCQKCHEPGRKVTAERCLSCHKPIAERIAQHKGVHRDVKDDCVSCHVEHAGRDAELRPLDRKSFDHTKETGFALDGKHATVKCESCHKTRSFLTARPECASCHLDVHRGALGPDCARCHSTAVAFRDAAKSFDHALAAFALTGAHRTVACEKCHANKVFKGIAFANCTDCHHDPHRGSLGANCASCHATDSWRTERFDHARTGYPLLGLHASVKCASCHVQPATRVRLAFATCADCHRDPHRGIFKQDCASCHDVNGFRGARFDHATRARFPLLDRHAEVPCASCHRGAAPSAVPVAERVVDFRGASTACVSCHKDPHAGQLGTACESCHGARTFRITSFKHPRFPEFFTGAHANVPCGKCHGGGDPPGATPASLPLSQRRYRGLSTDCASCHRDVHLGQLGANCASCHSIQAPRFAAPGFDHGRVAFALSGAHTRVACQKCHRQETGAFPAGHGTAVRYSGVPPACASCHRDVHLGQLGDRCQACHTTATFKVERFAHTGHPEFFAGKHATAACQSCHKAVEADFPAGHGVAVRLAGVSPACASCHEDVHRGTLGTACASCHTVQAWKNASRAFHKATQFPLEGKHQDVPCASCHINGQLKGTPTRCYDCHWIRHQDDRFQTRLGLECENCHRPTVWRAVLWDHATATGFALSAAHRGLDCQSCHRDGTFLGDVSPDCYSCHRADFERTANPPHVAAGFPTTCDTCHKASDTSWQQGWFDHGPVFPLLGQHAAQPCAACHKNNIFKGTPVQCAGCHSSDYQNAANPNHTAAAFDTNCQTCHNAGDPNWQQGRYAHTTWPLLGAHAIRACRDCHGDNVFHGKPTACATCHLTAYQQTTNPNHAAAGFPTTCDTCHKVSDTAWTQGVFNHAQFFQLVGVHATQPCAACHANNNYTTVSTTCFGCHLSAFQGASTPVNHAGLPTTCDSCHSSSDPAWTAASAFNHSSFFPLAGAHVTTACASCHTNGNFTTVPSGPCFACHATDYQNAINPVNHVAAGFPTACDTCHKFSDSAWTQGVFNHAQFFQLVGVHATQPCAACHVNNVFAGTPTQCVGCHLSAYQQTTNPNHAAAGFPTTCDTCHKASDTSWTQATFNHAQFFPLAGVHATTPCASCHVNNNYTTVPTTCFGCHQSAYQNASTPVNHAGLPTACDSCHGFADPAWTVASTFNHSSYFPLAGAHVTTACTNCHTNGNFTTVPTGPCYACHATDYQNAISPVNHIAAGFPTTCDLCHRFSDTSWLQGTFNHTWFPINHGNSGGVCATCHTNPTNYAVFSCTTGCHPRSSTDPQHQGVAGYVYSSPACYSCHPNGSSG